MMRICALGSGSSGNCIYIGDENSALLLDAGFSAKEILKRLKEAGLDPALIKGVVVTHEHSDHAKGVGVISRKLKIPVYISAKTFGKISHFVGDISEVVHFNAGEDFEAAGLSVLSFATPHDAVDPCAFQFRTNGTKVAVVTDVGTTSMLIEERIKDVDYLMIEANHNREMLMAGPYPWELKQRVASRKGHLSNEDSGKLVKKVAHPNLQGVTFAHLSETNNNPNLVRQVGEDALDASQIPFTIASQGYPDKVIDIE